MTTLPYICNEEQIQQIHSEETKKFGIYHFIRKVGEKGYNAYRKVDMGGNKGYYVQTHLPKEVFESLIRSGKMDKIFN